MEFGIFDHVEMSDPDLARVYDDRLRVAQAADEAGFYCYHVAEHQGTPLSMAPSPNVLLSAIAQRTTRILYGALCYILPLYDPLRLVNEICMLDQLGGGRVQIGIGRGVSPIEMAFFKIDAKESRAIFEEDLEIIVQALTTDTLTYHGRYHDYSEVPIVLRPRQLPHPPIWYPTSGIDSVPFVTKNRFHTVFLGDPNHIAEQVRVHHENLPPSPETADLKLGMLRYVFVAETDAEAMAIAAPTYRAHLANLYRLAHATGVTDRAAVPDLVGARQVNPEEIADAVKLGWAAVGSPATVAEQIEEMQAATGCNYLVFNPLLAGTDGDRGVACVQLFADQVMPLLANR